MKKCKNMPAHMHNNPHLMSLYPALLGQVAQTWFRVDARSELLTRPR